MTYARKILTLCDEVRDESLSKTQPHKTRVLSPRTKKILKYGAAGLGIAGAAAGAYYFHKQGLTPPIKHRNIPQEWTSQGHDQYQRELEQTRSDAIEAHKFHTAQSQEAQDEFSTLHDQERRARSAGRPDILKDERQDAVGRMYDHRIKARNAERVLKSIPYREFGQYGY